MGETRPWSESLSQLFGSWRLTTSQSVLSPQKYRWNKDYMLGEIDDKSSRQREICLT